MPRLKCQNWTMICRIHLKRIYILPEDRNLKRLNQWILNWFHQFLHNQRQIKLTKIEKAIYQDLRVMAKFNLDPKQIYVYVIMMNFKSINQTL